MKLDIDLPEDLVATESPPKALATLSAEIETMLRALESPRGIAITTGSPLEATALRFRLYRARNIQHKVTGRATFGSLIMTIEGNRVLIRRREAFQEEEL